MGVKIQCSGLQARKQQEQRPKGDRQKQQERGLEEQFLAKTKGGSDPDAAFESRLEEMKRRAQIAVKVGAHVWDSWQGGFLSEGTQRRQSMPWGRRNGPWEISRQDRLPASWMQPPDFQRQSPPAKAALSLQNHLNLARHRWFTPRMSKAC